MVEKNDGTQNQNERVTAMKEGKGALENIPKEISYYDVCVGLSAACESIVEEELAVLEQEWMERKWKQCRYNFISIASIVSDTTIPLRLEALTQVLLEIDKNISASK